MAMVMEIIMMVIIMEIIMGSTIKEMIMEMETGIIMKETTMEI